MRVFDVCFEMQGGSKNYYPFGERIFELLNTIKSLGQRCSLVSKTQLFYCTQKHGELLFYQNPILSE